MLQTCPFVLIKTNLHKIDNWDKDNNDKSDENGVA